MARRTRNSRDSTFFPTEELPVAPGVATMSSVENTTPPPTCSSPPIDQSLSTSGPSISPEILAAIQAAASQAAIAAVQASMASQTSAFLVPSVPSVPAVSPNVPPSSLGMNLSCQANDFLASGGFSTSEVTGTAGRPIVPSFMSMSLPVSLSQSICSAPRLATSVVASSAAVSPILEQPFVVGPGFSPIPAKLVHQIVAGKYVDLSELMAANLQQNEPEPQLLLDGRLMLTTTSRKPKRRIEDVVSWVEAFSIFTLVMTTYFPHRWRDLTAYKLLILRTYRQLSGRVWLQYDKAFREHAAATRMTDWSDINVQLFNFHAAGASVRAAPYQDLSDSDEPAGSKTSHIICNSWNRGKCIAPLPVCKYSHKCSTCSGSHRVRDCSRSKDRGRSRSPASSRDKARHKH